MEASNIESSIESTSSTSAPCKKFAPRTKNGITTYWTKKGPRYLVQIRIANRPVQRESFDSMKEARQWQRDNEGGSAPLAPTKATVAEVIDAFLADKAQTVKGVTQALRDQMKRLKAAFPITMKELT